MNWVLMTAMPPTIGHEALVKFSVSLGATTVVLCTQPEEPLVFERRNAVEKMCRRLGANFIGIHETMPQSETEFSGFREMWRDKMRNLGFRDGDTLVASETYAIWLAEMLNGHFMPFDIERSIVPIKATEVRKFPGPNWYGMIPEFREQMVITVTFFGAESCGKTTLSKAMSEELGTAWLPEYARPYLETVGNEVSRKAMMDIWQGQRAIETIVSDGQTPIVMRDTDLYSTYGYWTMPNTWNMGEAPEMLLLDAEVHEADLYVICSSDIPFEVDPLRYGGDKRESSDDYWIGLAEKFKLDYIVVEGDNSSRMEQVEEAITQVIIDKWGGLSSYERR